MLLAKKSTHKSMEQDTTAPQTNPHTFSQEVFLYPGSRANSGEGSLKWMQRVRLNIHTCKTATLDLPALTIQKTPTQNLPKTWLLNSEITTRKRRRKTLRHWYRQRIWGTVPWKQSTKVKMRFYLPNKFLYKKGNTGRLEHELQNGREQVQESIQPGLHGQSAQSYF